MNAIEFITNYEKYIREIRSVIKSNLDPVIDEMADKDPHDLITPETWFPNETAARGFVWSLFIDAVNEYYKKPITLDIEDIDSVEDMELFFALIYKEGILYHPDFSFADYMNSDISGKQTVTTFTNEESRRLDELNEKCFEVAGRENINVYEASMRIQRLIWGDPEKKRPTMTKQLD